MSDLSDAIVRGVTTRLRTLLLALDRQDRLETAHEFVGWLTGEASPERLENHSRELLLRALRVAGDSTNFRILTELDPVDPIGIGDLMKITGSSRVAVSERVNDMAQTGLAVREMVNDQVRGTDLSEGLCALVDAAAEQAGLGLAEELAGPASPAQERAGS